jgi:hypothetical protein
VVHAALLAAMAQKKYLSSQESNSVIQPETNDIIGYSRKFYRLPAVAPLL